MASKSGLSSLRIQDFQILHEAQRAKSVREVARRLNMTPGQVSKSIDKMETKLALKLFKRSASGVLLTGEGAALTEITSELLAQIEKIEGLPARQAGQRQTVAIGSTSFLTTHFVTPITCRFASRYKDVSFRFLDLAPHQLVPAGLRGAFDVAIHYGRVAWPKTWTSERLGSSNWVLCVRHGHPLPSRASLAKVLEYEFVTPTYWTPEGLEHGNDQFPIPVSRRRTGYETATAEGAIPVLLATDQIAFLPALLAGPFVAKKMIRTLHCPEVKTIGRDLHISARSISVPNRLFLELKQALSSGLG